MPPLRGPPAARPAPGPARRWSDGTGSRTPPTVAVNLSARQLVDPGLVPLVRSALVAAGLWFVFWAATSQQMRLFVPALPLLAIACAAAMSAGLDRLVSSPRSRATGGVALFVLGVAFVILYRIASTQRSGPAAEQPG